MNNKNIRIKKTLDLDTKTALEWLANYSSQISDNSLNNTLLVDPENYIIWYKYNWVDKETNNNNNNNIKKYLVLATNLLSNNINGFYIIDINKKAIFIEWKWKYDSKFRKALFKAFQLKDINTIKWVLRDIKNI